MVQTVALHKGMERHIFEIIDGKHILPGILYIAVGESLGQ